MVFRRSEGFCPLFAQLWRAQVLLGHKSKNASNLRKPYGKACYVGLVFFLGPFLCQYRVLNINLRLFSEMPKISVLRATAELVSIFHNSK